MLTLQEVLQAIDHLTPAEREQVRKHLGGGRPFGIPTPPDDPEAKVAMLREAVATIREGMSEADLREMEWAMNVEYVDSEAPRAYDWMDDDEDTDL